MLRGRERERAVLGELIDQARAGHGGALVVRGQPGVGKSALLDDAVRSAADVQVLRAVGVESEAPLPFAALHRLLRPVVGHLPAVPEAQASALRAAFGETGEEVGDRHRVFLATLNLLSEAGAARPVLAVVDDAHWLDDASAAALMFTARRLQGEAVALVLGVREGEADVLSARDVPALEVGGVDAETAEAIITDHAQATVAPSVRAELLATTGGNPLGLAELTSALTPAQLEGHEPLPARLPVTKEVEEAFLDRYHRLSAGAQTLLLLAAADDSGRTATVLRAATLLGGGDGAASAALDDAELSGLVRVDDGRLTLRHPLVRSAIYGAATSARRRQAHRALADALAGSAEQDRRAWHLAAAVEEPDEEVVSALDEAAQRSRRRGGHEAAAAAYARAAELTTDKHARGVRLLAAAESSLMAGRPAQTDQYVRTALVDATEPDLRADLLQLRGQVEWNTRSLDDGYRTVCEAAATAAPHDPDRARLLAMLAASLAAFGARAPDAPDPMTIAPPLEAEAPPEAVVAGRLLEGFSAVASGDWAAAARALRQAWATPLDAAAPPLLAPNLAIATMHLGEDEHALRLHDLQLLHARAAGAVNMIEHALTRGAVFRIATGAWSAAASAAQEALLLDRNLGLDELSGFPLAELALVAALRGDPEAPRLLQELEQVNTQHPPRGVTGGLLTGLTHWAAARQPDVAADTALRHLEQVRLPVLQGMSALDRLETAVRADRRDLAEEWLRELGEMAEGADAAWAHAVVHHGQALLGGPDVEQHFRHALEWHARSPRVPDLARTQLALGEHLRRNRRRTDARAHLREAIDLFDTLGAGPWAERARQELRASGETVRRGTHTAVSGLTAQEAQVAALVRQGLSNKDAAARLFISPRTVDFHLRNVYTKLGITSRTELAALPADPGTGIPPTLA